MHPSRPPIVLLALVALSLLPACKGCGPDPTVPDGGTVPPPGALLVWGTVVSADENPLAGAEVFLEGQQATTDAEGHFALRVEPVVGGAATLVARAADHLEGERRIRLDPSAIRHAGTLLLTPRTGMLTLDGSAGGTLSAEGWEIEVPAGAFRGEVTVELAVIPVDDPLIEDLRLPARIPTAGRRPVSTLFAFALSASGQQPASPLTLTVPAPVPLPADLGVPVGRFDRSAGAWVDAAVATVGPDGRLGFAIDHLSTFAAALPALPDEPTPAPDLDTLTRVASLFPAGEPRVEPKSGALQVGVPLPPLVRRGSEVALTLFHDSRTLVPALEVSTLLPEAAAGETRNVKVFTPAGDRRIGALVDATVTADLPAMVSTRIEAPRFEASAATAEATPVLETGTHPVEVVVSESVPGHLLASTSESFTAPEPGPALTLNAAPVPAPAPVAVRNLEARGVPVDDRGASPFGPGWHLRGLTRLVQPSCQAVPQTLAGGFEVPAATFGDAGTLYLVRVDQALLDAGATPEQLATPPLLAFSGEALYLAIHGAAGGDGGTIWRLPDDGPAVQLAGGGPDLGGPPSCESTASELHLRTLTGLAPAPGGDGVLFASEDCVFHLDAAGTLTRRMGRPISGGQAPGPGVSIDRVDFGQELSAFAAGPGGAIWLVESWLAGPFLVRDGVLEPLRMRSGGPQAAAYAFDPNDVLYYSHHTNPCVYRHVDGLTDPEVFPTCLQGYPAELLDGPAETATVGSVESMAFDEVGRLWLIDGSFRALRRMDLEGEVATISGGTSGELSGLEGPAESATLGLVYGVAAGATGEVAVTGAGPVLRLEPVPEGELEELGTGDGSILRADPAGGWERRLPDGRVEHYDERGLLTRRGLPGAPPLEYAYESWSTPLADESCGHPVAPPRLRSISLSGEALYSFSYGGARLERIRDAAGRETTLSWDADRPGEILPVEGSHAFRYDPEGRIVQHTRPGPAGSPTIFRYTFTDGRLVSAEVPGRGTRSWKPAEAETTVPEAEFSPAGVARQVDAAPGIAELPTPEGAPASVALGKGKLALTDAAGSTTELELDPLGRVRLRRMPDGSELSFSRDAAGRVVEIHDRLTDDRWRLEYDPVHGRMTRRTDPAGRRVSFRYDEAGRLVARTDPGTAVTTIEPVQSGPAAGQPARVVDPIGRETLIEYDLQGNATRFLLPGDLETLVVRNGVGRAVQVTRPDGTLERTEYDAFGGITLQAWGDDDPATPTTHYQRVVAGGWEAVGSHLPASALVAATDPAGRAWTWDRDLSLLPSRLVTPAGGEVRQRFDIEGRRTGRTLADSSVESFSYDAAGRLERRSWSGAASGASLALTHDTLGRVESLTDPLLTETRGYAPGVGWTTLTVTAGSTLSALSDFVLRRDRVSPSVWRQTLGPTAFTLHRGFDERVERVEFEDTGLPGSAQDGLVFTLDASRTLVRIDRANGVSTIRTLDAAGRVSRQEEVGPGGMVTLDFTYDAAGRPATRTLGGTARSYGYDALGRLASCSDTGESYGYDAVGARSADAAGAYTRDAAGRLTASPGKSHTHDALGRRTLDDPTDVPAQRQVYRWGPGGQLAEVSRGPAGAEISVARFEYDGSGRRVRMSTATDEWRYGYLPDTDRPVRILDPAGAEWHLVHALPDAAFTLAVSDGGAERYTHLDPFGRVLGISDEAGNLELLDEDCFGRLLAPVAMSGPPVGLHGQLQDTATGLIHSGARTLDPATGEFLSPDPAGLEGGPDPYGYAGGNPVIQADPGGRLFFALAGAALAGALIYKELKDFSQSGSVRRARRSYEQMTEVEDDDALAEAEEAHERLHEAADEGGDTAIRCTKRAVEAITDPASDAGDLKDSLSEAADEFLGSEERSGDDPS